MRRALLAPAGAIPTAGSLGRTLLAKAIGNAGLNAATLVFNLAIALILTHVLGSEGYGAYAFAISWVALLAVPAVLGLPPLLVREIARSRVAGNWGAVHGVIRRANQAALGASALVIGSTVVVFVLTDWPHAPLRNPTLAALPIVLLIALISLRQGAMQGFDRVVVGRTPEALVSPLLAILLIVAFDVALRNGLSATWAIAATATAAGLATLVGAFLLRRTVPEEVRRARPVYATRAWALGALPLLLMSGIGTLNDQVGTVLLGAVAGAQEVGVFSVATRAATLIPFLLLAAVPTLMPSIAELHARGQRERLQELMTHAARLVFYGSLPIVLIVVVAAEPLLRIFGSDFGEGATPLRILALAQIVNIATGFPGTILMMVGDSGRVAVGVAAGAAANVLLNLALIPSFGATGAAIAGGASIALTNIVLAAALWRRRGIWSPALGRPWA
jgi:O-antigen/teichoic acid export membrane protein